MKKLVFFVVVIAIFLPSCTKTKIKVWVASPWERVIRDTPPGDLQSVFLKAASNEYEPFRLIIHNEDNQPVTGLNVTVSDLKSTDSEIPAGNIKLYRANYLYIDKPSPNTSNTPGWYPDALIPFMENIPGSEKGNIKYIASPFSVDIAQNAEIWCDLYVPKGTKPGLYQGNVTVIQDKAILAVIPVNLDVWNFEIPEKITMPSYFGGMEFITRLLKIDQTSQEFMELEQKYNNALLNHRAVPSTPSSVWPEWNEKDGLIENGESERMKKLVEVDGFNVLDMPFRYRNEPAKCRKYLAATAEWLKKLGYLDIAYIYLEDEPNTAEQYEIVRKQGALIRSANPEIKRLCTEQTITSDPAWGNLYGAVDIWCPLWGLWDEQTAKERLAKGEILWSYTALCQGSKETPWWEIDMEPINFRSPMWISWHYNITGFLYWASVYWGSDRSLEEVWVTPTYVNDSNHYWGEGLLLYPGDPAGLEDFVPSIRLKLYREAEEDYEYMTLAAKSGTNEEVTGIVNTLATSFQSWSHDVNAYSKARQQLADIIMKNR